MSNLNVDDKRLIELIEGLILQYKQDDNMSSIVTPFCTAHNASLVKAIILENNLNIFFFGGYDSSFKYLGLIKEESRIPKPEDFGISIVKLEWARFEPLPKGRELKRLIFDYCPPQEVGDILIDDYVEIMLTNSAKARLIEAKHDIEAYIKCQISECNKKTISHKYGTVKNIYLSSNRLDSIVSKIYHLPRSESAEAISMGYIAINNTREINTDRKVSLGSEIYFRGRGICKIQEQQESKKGRICIKYVELNTIQT